MAGRDGRFDSTRWSLVLAAGRAPSGPGRRALEELCEAYWPPVYAYVRRRGHAREEAEDLTQAFFAALLEKRYVRDADPARGRFRSFLLSAVTHFLANERDRETALKRGGGRPIADLDAARAEPARGDTPERAYERRWALSVLDRVLEALAEEQARAGNAARFARLRDFLAGEGEGGYAPAARDLGVTESAVKVAVHRLRRRYRELLRAEIAETIADAAEVDDELRALMAALG